jgi:hypothetical protein
MADHHARQIVVVIDLPHLLLRQQREDNVNAEIAHHVRDRIDPPTFILDELNLEAAVSPDLIPERGRQILIRNGDERIVNDDHIEFIQIKPTGVLQATRIERMDLVRGILFKHADMIEDRIGVPSAVVAKD